MILQSSEICVTAGVSIQKYNAKTLNPEWMKDGPPGTKYARSENGWIDTDLFEHWFINHFLTHAVSSRPLLLLILDGHKTHYQLHVCQEARKQEVIIFCLPPILHTYRSPWIHACSSH